MLVEIAFLLLAAISGRLLLSRSPGPDSDPSGLLVGTAVYVASVAVLLVLGLPARPSTGILLTLTVAVLAAASRSGRPRWSSLRPRRRTALAGSLVLVTGAVFHPLRLVRDATDASAHLAYGARLQEGTLVLSDVGVKRGLSFGAIEAVGVFGGDVAVMGVVPAFGAAGLLAVYAIVRSGDVAGDSGCILGLIAVAVVATNARFITNLVLIGPHLVIAFWMLLLIAVLASAKDDDDSRPAWARLITLAALALAVGAARGEGALLVVLAALPFLAHFDGAGARPREVRAVAVGLLIWLIPYHSDRFTSVPEFEGLGMIALALGLLLATLRPVVRMLGRVRPVGLALTVSWAALLALLIIDFDRTTRSIVATAANVALDVGGWGVGLLLMITLAFTVRWISRAPLPMRMGLLLGSFLPAHLLLGTLTGASFRIGEGSSLNRMLFHVYLVLVVAVSAAILRMVVNGESDERQGLEHGRGAG